MYRLLNLKPTSFRNLPGVSFNFTCDFKVKQSACLGRQELEYNPCKLCARFQSSLTNPSLKKPRKTRMKSKKKYYDLLVVTDTATRQQKTSIKKLTWDDLRLLASTNLNLSELHKLKDHSNNSSYIAEHTYNNLTEIDIVDSTASLGSVATDVAEKAVIIDTIPEEIEEALIPTDPIPDIPMKLDAFQPETGEECETDEKAQLTQTRRAPYEVAVKTLGSYLEVCSKLNSPGRGLNALMFHNARASRGRDKHFSPIKCIKVYNALLKGLAKSNDISKLEEVLNMIKSEHVMPNIQTYIAIFECYGSVNVKNMYLKQLRIYAKEALSHGFCFDRIMNEGTFLNDERQVVLAAMTACDPNYSPNYHKPVLQYSNHLVNHLNNDKQLCQHKQEKSGEKTGLFTKQLMQDKILKQLELEKNGYITIRSIGTKDDVGEEVQKYRETLKDLLKTWQETAQKAFNRDLLTLTAQRSPLNYEPYMRSLPVKEFVNIIVDEAKKIAEGSETYSPTVGLLYRDMGNRVYARYKVLQKQKTGVLDKVIQIHSDYCEDYVSSHGALGVLPNEEEKFYLNPRQKWQWAEFNSNHEGSTLSMDHREWSPSLLQTIGKFLYRIVMHDLKVDVNSMRNSRLANSSKQNNNYLPAFYTIFRVQNRVVKEEVKPHPVLSKLYRSSMPETLTFAACDVPMICPPIPWTCIENGGYLVSPCEVVRLPPQATAQKQRLHEAGSQQLFPSLDALNQLAAVPWQVNRKILDVILEVFKKGGSAKLDVPQPPSSLPQPPAITSDMDKGTKFNVFRQKLQFKRKKAEMYSLWCDCLYRLSLANHFKDDVFWLPHNMDFRGRVYPVPPHLNHLGSDLARSMLIFAESRPLGPEGLDWLKIHLINLTGLKKRDSVDQRLKYANEILDDILDSADRPLTGKMWWAQSEEPWQTLACCMDIAEATRSVDPEKYRSCFPVHQDGSCNGLQHYAALGRDSAGAYSVNLCPSQVPQDVYSAVVALVEEQRIKDASNGLEVAKLLDGFVKRKVIKQTIMTTVYGVTRFGARLQIAKQLKDLDEFPKDAVWSASSYLTGRTFESLRTMFKSTREIQDWFTECARLISAVTGQQVEWVTPMGLPIVQPYFRYKSLGSTLVYKPFHMDQFEKPNVMKQKNAFPPNFIHSLDSSHMMLTSLHCEREGISFVSVHDCYWTHPSTVQIMNKICREQFVTLHSQPILENLSLFMSEKYSFDNHDFKDDGSVTDLSKKKLNRALRKLPKTGDFDINQVLESVYFFS